MAADGKILFNSILDIYRMLMVMERFCFKTDTSKMVKFNSKCKLRFGGK